ncbi:MAG: glycosyltransferase family 2 protein [Weeksellaceae bacterium]|nr:glycosyltransferase family 2 protein [Weeksellaceae bacterium]
MKITTIIVTYNSLRNNWLPLCLDSLKNSSQQTDIIIVDNNSADDTCNFIKENYPKIFLISSKENLGFGKGNNLGISEALKRSADFVFLLNQDTVVKENTIELLLEAAIKNTEFAILSPIHLNYAGTDLEFYFNYFMRIRNTPHFLRDHILNTKKEIYETNFVNAAAWFIPVKIFSEIGGFDPIFSHYGEDDNYCQRVLFHKYKIGIVPNCFINHDSDERKRTKNYKYSPQYFSDYVKRIQATYANVNVNIENDFKYEKNTLFFTFLSNLLLLKFEEVKASLKKKRLLEETFKGIYKSREINRKRGKHYLDS